MGAMSASCGSSCVEQPSGSLPAGQVYNNFLLPGPLLKTISVSAPVML